MWPLKGIRRAAAKNARSFVVSLVVIAVINRLGILEQIIAVVNRATTRYNESIQSSVVTDLAKPTARSHTQTDLTSPVRIEPSPSVKANNASSAKKRPYPQIKVHRINDYWQQVINDALLEIYFYSAYYDDRPALDRPLLRIIGLVESKVNRMFCRLWYQRLNQSYISVANRSDVGQEYYRHGKRFKQIIYSCPISPYIRGVPEFVSLVLSPDVDNFTTYLRVNVPVKPNKPPRDNMTFGQCVKVAYGYHDPWRLVEWIELQLMWGVQEITIYNHSLDARSAQVYQYYARRGIVDIRQMPSVMSDRGTTTILLGMAASINDCMYRNMYRYTYVLGHDIDELIVPRSHHDYRAMMKGILEVLRRKHPGANLDHIKSFMFQNVYFFLEFEPSATSPLLTQRHLKRIQPSRIGWWAKSFVDPLACLGLQNHFCWTRLPKYRWNWWGYSVPPEIGMNQHYRHCPYEKLYREGYKTIPKNCDNATKEFEVDKTMQRFNAQLLPRVRAVLADLGLPMTTEKTPVKP